MSSSVECLRELINERLTAAAGEIFGAFRKTIVDLEEEINRQSRLLDIALKPEQKLHWIDVWQQEEVLRVQERSSSLDQEDPEPPQIKEEPLGLKQDTDALMVTPTNEEWDHTEVQTMCLNPDETVSAPEEQSDVKMPVIISVVSESNRDHQLLSNNSHLAESRDQKGDEHGDSGSTHTTELRPKRRPQGCTIHTENEQNSTAPQIKRNTKLVNESLKCNICGKTFSYRSILTRHMRSHTGERPYVCETCGRAFPEKSKLTRHMRTHTTEKPFTCEICGTDFGRMDILRDHKRRAHTGELHNICNTCGKRFFKKGDLTRHMKIHLGDKTYVCNTCGRAFLNRSTLTVHMRTHSGEKPFPCETCGKDFGQSTQLRVHKRRAHTGEKPYICNTCGGRFFEKRDLMRHLRLHSGEKPYISGLSSVSPVGELSETNLP